MSVKTDQIVLAKPKDFQFSMKENIEKQEFLSGPITNKVKCSVHLLIN